MDAATPEEELKLLEVRLNQLKLDYEKYFLGSRPTEPAMQRAEVQKIVIRWSNTRITNTALRFKFNSLNGRFQAFKRRWDDTLRQIEAGTYKRHVFKANLHDRERGLSDPAGAGRGSASGSSSAAGGGDDLFESYRDAMLATGQNASGLTREKLQAAVTRQEAALKKKLGCDRVDFKVVVQGGKVKLKAAAG
ncbi:MAG TPA: MXAN_5187 C-terminal domain-containing protein [Myxococcota bacterium]|nr:MXAN_5187 C-terminal domain-containing protein [Myxococcota bacterium]